MHTGSIKLRSETLFIFGTIGVLAGAFWLLASNLLWGNWTYDQGFYFLVARLMDNGDTPYHTIHMSEQPLIIWSAYLAYQIFGSVWGMQFAMIVYAVLGIAALISIGRSLNGRLTGLLAGLLFAAHFAYFNSARQVNPQTTSLSLALVAMALALHYRLLGKRLWLLLSAVAMAASFLLKLYMFVLVLVIALILLFFPLSKVPVSRPGASLRAKFANFINREKKRVLQDYLVWFGVMLALLVITWLIVGFPGWVEQSVAFYINRNATYSRDLMFNLDQVLGRLTGWPILLVLAVWGVGRAIIQFKQFGWIIITWLILTFIFLMSFTPLRGKHLAMLPPPITLLAALALIQLLGYWSALNRSHFMVKWSVRVATVCLLIGLAVEMAFPFKVLAEAKKPLVEGGSQTIVQGLEKFTSPNDCIITDDPYIAYVSNRLPPPWLSNMSYARFESGSLTTQDLIDITNRYNCQAVVPTFDRLKNGNRPYYDWAKSNYLRIWVVDGKEIMLGKLLAQANPALPAYANINTQVEFLGADWVELNNGDHRAAYASLYWKGLQPFPKNYKIFVHLRNQAGQTVAGADHEMFDGLLPTQLWPVNAILKDTIRLDLPEDTITPGQYTLYVGLYNPETLERLAVINDASGENAVVIPGVVIE